MRNMSASKRSSWVLVAALGVVGVSHWTAYAASLEDQQQAAGAIVTQAKGLAKVQGTDMDKKRSSVTVKDHSREYKLPIKKWEKGALITKDEKTGGEVRQEFVYPIFDCAATEIRIQGDNSLCWEVCKEACDGYGVCHSVCWWKCASQGGEGDPRKP